MLWKSRFWRTDCRDTAYFERPARSVSLNGVILQVVNLVLSFHKVHGVDSSIRARARHLKSHLKSPRCLIQCRFRTRRNVARDCFKNIRELVVVNKHEGSDATSARSAAEIGEYGARHLFLAKVCLATPQTTLYEHFTNQSSFNSAGGGSRAPDRSKVLHPA